MNENNYYIDGNLLVDFDANTAYLTISSCNDQLFTVQHSNIINIDYNSKGEIHGFELLSLNEIFPIEEMAEKNSLIWKILEKANISLAIARTSFKS